jgi:hypothetical protein
VLNGSIFCYRRCYRVVFSVAEEYLVTQKSFYYRVLFSATEDYLLLQRRIFCYKRDSSLTKEYLLLQRSIFSYREVSSVTYLCYRVQDLCLNELNLGPAFSVNSHSQILLSFFWWRYIPTRAQTS